MQVPGYSRAAVITPSDTVAIDPGFTKKAIYVGVAGDISALVSGNAAAVLFKAVPVGILNVRIDRVNVAATTATDMLVLGD